MVNFWNHIVETNTFNFIIMVVIFVIIFQKINISKIIQKIQEGVANAINNAQKEKQNADKALKDAKKTVKNTDAEIEENINTAKKNAKNLASEIKKYSDEQISHLRENIGRVVSAEEKKLSSKLQQGTIVESINLARENIINKLAEDPKLHEKLIEESIKELDKIC